ncbi:MAG TPA: DUF4337 domain-containing protein [Acetobacteraceae bacterium]|nr:DUF4337 domain-containing protein [Acetobacteraceae bacterium]
MTSAYRTLEHHEHAEHIAHGAHAEAGGGQEHAAEHAHAGFAQYAALMVAIFAAGLAISEQGAKHAEIRVQQSSIDAADAWAQYQAKSTRGTIAKDLAAVVAALEAGSDPATVARREKVIEMLRHDQERYENDPKDGKEAIAHRAHEFEHQRMHSLEQTHAYHNGSAGMELGIVLATASAITKSKLLIFMALGFGIGGAIVSLLGYFKPELGAAF